MSVAPGPVDPIADPLSLRLFQPHGTLGLRGKAVLASLLLGRSVARVVTSWLRGATIHVRLRGP